jgi:hypothetical protein
MNPSLSHLCIPAEVDPGAEAAAGTGDDGDPTVGVRVDLVECLVQADDQIAVHRVELFGPVQHDDRYVRPRMVEQHRVAHAFLLTSSSSPLMLSVVGLLLCVNAVVFAIMVSAAVRCSRPAGSAVQRAARPAATNRISATVT